MGGIDKTIIMFLGLEDTAQQDNMVRRTGSDWIKSVWCDIRKLSCSQYASNTVFDARTEIFQQREWLVVCLDGLDGTDSSSRLVQNIGQSWRGTAGGVEWLMSGLLVAYDPGLINPNPTFRLSVYKCYCHCVLLLQGSFPMSSRCNVPTLTTPHLNSRKQLQICIESDFRFCGSGALEDFGDRRCGTKFIGSLRSFRRCTS